MAPWARIVAVQINAIASTTSHMANTNKLEILGAPVATGDHSTHQDLLRLSQDVRPMPVLRTPSWRLLMPRRRWTASKPRLTRCLLSFSEDRDRRLCRIQVRAKRGREAFRLPVLSGLRRRRKNDTNHV